jgi:heat shock protein 5
MGRLSKEEIEKMLKDAEEFAEQDKIAKERIDAKNSLDSYIHSMTNSVEDPEKLAKKIEEDDKAKIKDALKEAQDWVEKNSSADKEAYEEKLKDLQKICDPIVSKVYGKSGGSSEGGSEEPADDSSHDDL